MEPALLEAHDRLEATHWWFGGRRRILAAVLERWLAPAPGRTILDVGCGTGGNFPVLSAFGTVEGAEYAPWARARAQAKFPGVPVWPCELPGTLPDRTYHLVTALDVVEHVAEAVASLEAMRARLRPGGQLVVTVPAFQLLWSRHDELNHHQRRYSAALLRAQLDAAGLEVQHLSHFNAALFPAVAGVRLLQRLAPALEGKDGDLAPAPRPLNWALGRLLAAEAPLVARLGLPYGVSLLAVARPRG